MKRIATLMIILVCSSYQLLAQDQTYTFTVNGKDYSCDEQRVNDLFGKGFQEMVNRGLAKNDDFEIWKTSFDRWKELAVSGRYNWSTYANRIGDQKYQGESTKEDLGFSDDGKLAKGNMNKKSNKAARMAYLNGLMAKYITNSLTEFKV